MWERWSYHSLLMQWHQHERDIFIFFPHLLSPVAGGGLGPGAKRAGETALPFIGCSSQQSWPFTVELTLAGRVLNKPFLRYKHGRSGLATFLQCDDMGKREMSLPSHSLPHMVGRKAGLKVIQAGELSLTLTWAP